MTTRTVDEEGYVTDDTIAYYLARAHGGVGLITVEMASPEKVGRHRRREVGIYDDRFLPGLARLVDEIVLVSERSLEEAVSLLLQIEKTLCEGAGAAPLAALLTASTAHAAPIEFVEQRKNLMIFDDVDGTVENCCANGVGEECRPCRSEL